MWSIARISNVVVKSKTTDLIEFNSSVTLSCSSSGYSPSFSWMNGSTEVTDGDRFQLSDRNATLTVFNVTRSDQKLLRCQAANHFSNGSSDPVNLIINCEFLPWWFCNMSLTMIYFIFWWSTHEVHYYWFTLQNTI